MTHVLNIQGYTMRYETDFYADLKMFIRPHKHEKNKIVGEDCIYMVITLQVCALCTVM